MRLEELYRHRRFCDVVIPSPKPFVVHSTARFVVNSPLSWHSLKLTKRERNNCMT